MHGDAGLAQPHHEASSACVCAAQVRGRPRNSFKSEPAVDQAASGKVLGRVGGCSQAECPPLETAQRGREGRRNRSGSSADGRLQLRRRRPLMPEALDC